MLGRELFTILEGTADAAYTVDAQGTIRSWNHAAEKLFGYKAAEVVNKSCMHLIEGRSALGTAICAEPCSIIECAVANREISNFDMEAMTQSGEKIWVNVSILSFHNERAQEHLVVHFVRDIGRRKQNEDLVQKLVEVAKQISSLPDDGSALPPASPLTDQERRVLRLLAEGKDPAKVSQELKITPRTLRNHIHHINQKLGTRNRLEAVMQAGRRNLI